MAAKSTVLVIGRMRSLLSVENPMKKRFSCSSFAFRSQKRLSVIDDMNDDCKIYVTIADMMQSAEAWGQYLADVARAMARDDADYLIADREDGNLFRAICDGFRQATTEEAE